MTNTFIEPNKYFMTFRFFTGIIQVLAALSIIIYFHSWILLAIWIMALLLFGTIARKFICSRCEGYGKKCYSLYLGLYTSKLFSHTEGKKVTIFGGLLEFICIGSISLLPIVALMRNNSSKEYPILLISYLALLVINLNLQFFHACRYCSLNATEEWKKLCPAYQVASLLWNRK